MSPAILETRLLAKLAEDYDAAVYKCGALTKTGHR